MEKDERQPTFDPEDTCVLLRRPPPEMYSLEDYQRRVLGVLEKSPQYFAKGRVVDFDVLAIDWPQELLTVPSWSRIESPVPGIADLPLDETWVNVTLREFDPDHQGTHRHLELAAWNELQFDRPGSGITPRELLVNLHGLTVVAGRPGAGKTTLLKWLARHVVVAPDCPFAVPVFVSLRHYAKEAATDPDLGLIDYFLKTRGITRRSHQDYLRLVLLQATHGVVLLLDGWDEVPVALRDRILPQLQALSRHPGVITTRYSGDPLRLPAERFYEVQGLNHGAALQLAHRWLRSTGREAYCMAIETGLEESADLRRMARSPFLLTLICALASSPNTSGFKPGFLPRYRGSVLGRTLDLIYAQHNQDPKQTEKFSREDQAAVANFSLWLLLSAPEAPRYVFDASDYARATGSPGRFDTLLVPSRLIARPEMHSDDYQFLHANFQEYLAAKHLARSAASITDWDALLLNQSWSEVTRLLVEVMGESAAREQLWAAARRASKRLDRYGCLAARIASMLAIAGETDGGRALLGLDIRDHLWRAIESYASLAPTQPLQAYLELDARDFARRVLDRCITLGANHAATAWLELVSVFDLEPLIEEEKYAEVIQRPEVAAFCSQLAAVVPAPSPQSEQFTAALAARDAVEVGTAFRGMVAAGAAETAYESVSLLTKLPEASQLLLEIATGDWADEMIRAEAVMRLLDHDRHAWRPLLWFLGKLTQDDPRVLPVLGNLSGRIPRGAEVALIEKFLLHEDPETRRAAIELLATTRDHAIALRLIERLEQERDGEVRVALLSALEDMTDVSTLWPLRESHWLKAAEWEPWFRAVAVTVQRAERHQGGVDPLHMEVRKWARQALQAARGTSQFHSLPAVLEFPFLLGAVAAPTLMRLALQRDVAPAVQIKAIGALAKVKDAGVVEWLLGMARNERLDAKRQEAVHEVLAALSPAALVDLITPYADQARAGLAYRRNMLFLSDDLLDASGRSMLDKKPKSTAAVPRAWPARTDVAVLLALQEEFNAFKRIVTRLTGARWSHKDDDKRAFTFYSTQIPLADGAEPLHVVAVCGSEMAPNRAANVGSALIERFSPHSVLVIGIAGSLSDDVLLGDVLVPNEVYSYLENSAVVDAAPAGTRPRKKRTSAAAASPTFQFKPSGKHYDCDQYLLNQVRQFADKFPELHRKWLERARRRMQRGLGTELVARALKKNIARAVPLIVAADHHLATGPSVGRSDRFASWLTEMNRKAAAMEMETAAVFDAVATMVEVPRRLAIRGISDFADHRKTKVEKQFKGQFRTLSMASAVDCFVMLAQQGIFSKPR